MSSPLTPKKDIRSFFGAQTSPTKPSAQSTPELKPVESPQSQREKEAAPKPTAKDSTHSASPTKANSPKKAAPAASPVEIPVVVIEDSMPLPDPPAAAPAAPAAAPVEPAGEPSAPKPSLFRKPSSTTEPTKPEETTPTKAAAKPKTPKKPKQTAAKDSGTKRTPEAPKQDAMDVDTLAPAETAPVTPPPPKAAAKRQTKSKKATAPKDAEAVPETVAPAAEVPPKPSVGADPVSQPDPMDIDEEEPKNYGNDDSIEHEPSHPATPPMSPGRMEELLRSSRRSRSKRSYSDRYSDDDETDQWKPSGEGASSGGKRRKLTDEERAARAAEQAEKKRLREEEEQKKLEKRQRELAEREEKKRLAEEAKKQRMEEAAKKAELKRQQEEEKERKKREKEEEKRRAEEEAKRKLERNAMFFKSFVKKAEAAAAPATESGAGEPEKKGIYSKVGSFEAFEPPADAILAPISIANKVLGPEERSSIEQTIRAEPAQTIESLLSSICEHLRSVSKRLRKTRAQFQEERRRKYDGKMDLTPAALLSAPLDQQSERIRELVLNESIKMLKFHENVRPPYHGTWSKRSRSITPRAPFKQDDQLLDYEIDSDEEWEDEADAESIGSAGESDDEPAAAQNGEADVNKDEYSFDEEFLVADGYLSEGEGLESASSDSDDNSNEIGNDELADGERKVKRSKSDLPRRDKKDLLERTKQNLRKRGDNQVVAIVIGPIFDLNQADKKSRTFLESHAIQMLVPTPYKIGEDEDFTQFNTPGHGGVAASGDKKRTGARLKPVPQEQLAQLLKLTHGNPNGIDKIVAAFMEIYPQASKRQIKAKIMECAKREKQTGWTKQAWFVSTELRLQYGIPEVLPPPPSPSPSKAAAATGAPPVTSPLPVPNLDGHTASSPVGAKPITNFFASPPPSTTKAKPRVKQASSAQRAAAAANATPSPVPNADIMIVEDSDEVSPETDHPRSPTKLVPTPVQ